MSLLGLMRLPVPTPQQIEAFKTLYQRKFSRELNPQDAKAPGTRPLFAQMIKMITKGEADAILCWHINRLARNPVDSGQLSWLLQQGILKSIRTPDREYRPEDNVVIFSVESSVANQYVI